MKQSPGFLSDNLQWMMAEADKLGFGFGSPERCGGIAVDEMSIQVIIISFIHMVRIAFVIQ